MGRDVRNYSCCCCQEVNQSVCQGSEKPEKAAVDLFRCNHQALSLVISIYVVLSALKSDNVFGKQIGTERDPGEWEH